MEDQTTTITKSDINESQREEPNSNSHFMQISVRAWLAIALIATICLKAVAETIVAILFDKPDLLKVTEPLYTMAGMALAYYFGQQKQQIKQQ